MKIEILENEFSICKVEDLSLVNLDDDFVFVGKTDEETSLVCQSKAKPNNICECEDGWKAFRINGVLDFSLIGIISKISSLLAENKIGIFAVSTYNTDYFFIKKQDFEKAVELVNAIE